MSRLPIAAKEKGMTTAQQAARETAKILLDIKAVHCNAQEPFKLTSGRFSPVYIDCRKIISFPAERARLMDLAVELIEREIGKEKLDSIAGGETAGIPFAAWIAERMNKSMLYVRKKPKGFGRMAQIEGDMKEGEKTILVEDLATDGGSKLAFVETLRKAGAKVDDTFVIFHYGIFSEGVESLKAIGIKLHALATWWDVLGAAEEGNYFDAASLQEVRAFLQDPHGWSRARGETGS